MSVALATCMGSVMYVSQALLLVKGTYSRKDDCCHISVHLRNMQIGETKPNSQHRPAKKEIARFGDASKGGCTGTEYTGKYRLDS
jgi:hypothetical protein